ncbi:MAG TPA: class I SAM-dependent methyltransferase [Gemmatimonadales bacterium]|nr:class I SAM-dependent methyltransferase [Gemmatimonadales bacterium]
MTAALRLPVEWPPRPPPPPAPLPRLPPATCRSCGAELTHTVVDLGMSPLGASCRCADQLDQTELFSPLRLCVCERCLLVQLPQRISDERIVSAYAHFSSSSASRLEHARRFTDRAIEELRLTPATVVVEVGSNDGYLLQYFSDRGIAVLGIEPWDEAARAAIARGIPTRIEFFSSDTARALRAEGIHADLLIGNDVLAQVRDVNDFAAGMKLLLAPRGVITLEFPHLMRLVAENQFDAIDHAHCSYFSLLAVAHILTANGLTIYDVDELDTRRGSLRVFACHSEDPLRPITPRVDSLLARERDAGVHLPAYYAEFAERVREGKRRLLDFLIAARRDGKRVVAYGATETSSTLLHYCGIDTDFLEYVVDRRTDTHGKYLPGTHIAIRPPAWIRQTRPDYVLILPWKLQHEIAAELAYIAGWGGRCVVPIPEVDMVT